MATKPQTYPEKIQALQAQLREKDSLLEKAAEQEAARAELQNKYDELYARFEELKRLDNANVGTSKAAFTDLQQRAESAEQGMRNYQRINAQLQQQVEDLDTLNQTRLRELGVLQDVESKLALTSTALKEANQRAAQCSDRSAERIRELQSEYDKAINVLNKVRQDRQYWYEAYTSLASEIRAMPDPFTRLKELVSD